MGLKNIHTSRAYNGARTVGVYVPNYMVLN